MRATLKRARSPPEWSPERGGHGAMSGWAGRNPFWALLCAVAAALVLWAIFAPWSEEMEAVLGRKRVFVNAVFNGITLGALYFLVATGFTLIFGLMKNVNLAHGALYLLGGYLGFEAARATGSWFLGFAAAFVLMAAAGVVLQLVEFRRMEGQDLRQTLVTIGVSIVLADLMLWGWGGSSYQIDAPDFLSGPVEAPIVTGVNRSGEPVYLRYPAVRFWILIASIVFGVALWLLLNRTRSGALIRAGVDAREMVAASGVRIQLIFLAVFAFGAGLAACRVPSAPSSAR
jgi:branched-chain amino acid transport system permease protein